MRGTSWFFFCFLPYLLLSIYLVSHPMYSFSLTYFPMGSPFLKKHKIPPDLDLNEAKRVRKDITGAKGVTR